MVLLEKLAVDPGEVVEAFQVGRANQLHLVAIAFQILGEQGLVVGLFIGLIAIVAALGGYVDLAAYDRVDASLFAKAIEVDCAVQVAVVGDGQAGHPQFGGPGHELLKSAEAVEQAVLGMNMKVREQASLQAS